jgi:N-succinyldiaminopimelate aminotransferase
VDIVTPEHVLAESAAMRSVFSRKRRMMIESLEAMGVGIDKYPEGTFYVWGNLENLPEPLRDGMAFFRAALEKQVIVVPGEFFDVNPGRRRPGRVSRFRNHIRFSFGPEEETLQSGLSRLADLVAVERTRAAG